MDTKKSKSKLENFKYYTSLFLGTLSIVCIFAFLFLVPFVLDPVTLFLKNFMKTWLLQCWFYHRLYQLWCMNLLNNQWLAWWVHWLSDMVKVIAYGAVVVKDVQQICINATRYSHTKSSFLKMCKLVTFWGCRHNSS